MYKKMNARKQKSKKQKEMAQKRAQARDERIEAPVSSDVTAPLVKTEQPSEHFDPSDNLNEKETQECYERAEKELQETNDKELNLAKSDITVPGQEWVLVSFVGEDCEQQTDRLGMKIWGCFDTIKEAKNHANRLNKMVENKIFNIYILEMYTWARIPPDNKCINDQNYHEEELHSLITAHKLETLKAKEVFDLRKKKLQENQDINEFKKNKEELNALMESDEPKIQNEEAMKQAMGETLKLPKIEIIEEHIKKEEETT